MKIYGINGKTNLIGSRVRDRRIFLHLTQTQLAARLQLDGISLEQKAISRIELGKRVVADYELLALSQVLGVSICWLLGVKESCQPCPGISIPSK
ncbi:MAG TPA: helix-turn-helix domain-containing protein [Firmicutes bacterium]|nr:helix-turn-helix domain-containing protein [Bacillota bacterium]